MDDIDVKKTKIETLVLFIIFVSIFLIPTIFIIFARAPSFDRFESYLRRNFSLLTIVKEYLLNQEFENIHITKSYPMNLQLNMFSGLDTGSIVIGDEAVERAIRRLFRRGYNVITKEEEIITFQRWSNLRQGRGLLYFNDEEELENRIQAFERISEVTPLSKTGWYFYISE